MALAGVLLWPASLSAQPQYEYDSNTDYQQQDESPYQENPEVPKGLTLVPWKIERREDRIELPGSSRQQRNTQPAQNPRN